MVSQIEESIDDTECQTEETDPVIRPLVTQKKHRKCGVAMRCGARLIALAFDRMAFGAPAQHASGEIGDMGEAPFRKQHRRLR